jgi:hypothetical protein
MDVGGEICHHEPALEVQKKKQEKFWTFELLLHFKNFKADEHTTVRTSRAQA